MTSKIYTKTGDKGSTALYGGGRVSKDHLRVEAYGTLDELNAWIGLLRDQDIREEQKAALIEIQNRLFTLGSELATPADKLVMPIGHPRLPMMIDEKAVDFLEIWIDRMQETLPPLKHFILPGGHPIVSYAQIGRTVCRRAERIAVALDQIEPLRPVVLKYFNRLSDYLFVLARRLGFDHNYTEQKWNTDTQGPK